MNKLTLILATICLAATSHICSAETSNSYGTLSQVLRSQLSSIGWNLDWSLQSDYPVLENGKSIIERTDLTVGAKIRFLTARNDLNGEFDVWVCEDFKVLVVTTSRARLNDKECMSRLNTELDL